MRFSDVIGHEQVKQKLIRTVREGRVSHAQLFLGPEGSGKLSLAVAYAQFINCRSRSEDDSCGVCPSCVKYEKLIHPDLHFVYPVNTTTEVKKDAMSKDFVRQWRELFHEKKGYFGLNDWYAAIGIEKKQGIINAADCNQMIRTLSLKAYEAPYKVMIIWMAEKIFYSAAPKILKILEEPPDNTLFLLITENQDKIISTILSRTQLVRIPRIKDIDLLDHLINVIKLNADKARNIVTTSNGNYLVADSMIGMPDDSGYDWKMFRKWMLHLHAGDIKEVASFTWEMAKTGREKQKQFLLVSTQWIRKAFISGFNEMELKGLNPDESDFVKKFGRFIAPEKAVNVYEELNTAIFHIERNGNPSLVFMDLSLKLRSLLFAKQGRK